MTEPWRSPLAILHMCVYYITREGEFHRFVSRHVADAALTLKLRQEKLIGIDLVISVTSRGEQLIRDWTSVRLPEGTPKVRASGPDWRTPMGLLMLAAIDLDCFNYEDTGTNNSIYNQLLRMRLIESSYDGKSNFGMRLTESGRRVMDSMLACSPIGEISK